MGHLYSSLIFQVLVTDPPQPSAPPNVNGTGRTGETRSVRCTAGGESTAEISRRLLLSRIAPVHSFGVRRLLAHPPACCLLPPFPPPAINQPTRRRRTIKPARPAPAQLASFSGATTTAPPWAWARVPAAMDGTATPTEEAGTRRRRIRGTRFRSRDSLSPSRACWAPAGWWSPTRSSPTSPSSTSTAASRTPPATAPRRCSAGTGNHLTVTHNFFDSDTLYLSNSTLSWLWAGWLWNQSIG
jgi:hypothetical protein